MRQGHVEEKLLLMQHSRLSKNSLAGANGILLLLQQANNNGPQGGGSGDWERVHVRPWTETKTKSHTFRDYSTAWYLPGNHPNCGKEETDTRQLLQRIH